MSKSVNLPEIKGTVAYDEPMAGHTTFKIGGPADIFVVAEDLDDLETVFKWANENAVPTIMLGAGTNVLVTDKGIRGLVISLGSGFGEVIARGTELYAGAGARISSVVRQALGRSLRGLEGLAGVPGTVGGAIYQNAGTSHGCIADSLAYINAIDQRGKSVRVPASELGFRYRGSRVGEMGLIITEAVFELTPGDAEEMNSIIQQVMSGRKINQPVGVGTAGSVFKNPPDGFAGELLDKAGAKGMQVGGARVSSKHANWIMNTGAATSDDVLNLISQLQELVFKEFGISLEPEIQIVGE